MTCIFSSRCGKQDYFPQIEFEIISFAYRVFIVNLFLRRGNSCFQHWFNEFAILSESFFEQSLWPSLTNCLILQRNHNLDNPVLTTFYMQIPYDVISVMHVFSNYGWSPWHKEAPLCGLILSLLSDSRRSWSCPPLPSRQLENDFTTLQLNFLVSWVSLEVPPNSGILGL